MKKIFTGIALLASLSPVLGQKETGVEKDNGDVIFEDGTVINFKMQENDPSVRVNWTAMAVFRPVYFEKLLSLGLGVKAMGNLWDIAEFRGLASGGLHVDVSMPENDIYKSEQKQYQNHYAETSIKFYETETIKTSSILLGEKTSGYYTTSYFVSGDLKYRQRCGIIGGIEYTQRRVATDQFYTGAVVDTNENGLENYSYKPLTIYQTNVRLGLDVTWITSSLVDINRVRRVDYQHGRIYSMVLLPISQRLDVVKYPNAILPTGEEALLVDTEEYMAPSFSTLGYLLGFDLINEYGDKGGRYFGFSMEVGILPGIKYDNVFDNFTANLGVSFGFGNDLTKGWAKRANKK